MKSGIAAGQVAAWVIFGLFLSVDATLMTPPGTFYRMIGMALGQGPPADLYTGFALHMATATAIGVIYMVISNLIKPLYIGSVRKLQWTQKMNLIGQVVTDQLGTLMTADTGEWGTFAWT